MTFKNSQQEKVQRCKFHPLNKNLYVCLEDSCIKNPIICMICIKNNHKNCNNDLIIEKNEFVKRIKFVDKQNMFIFKRKVIQIVEFRLYEFFKHLGKIKRQIINKSFPEILEMGSADQQFNFSNLKKNYNIEHDEQKGMFYLKNKFDNDDIIRKELINFQKKLEKLSSSLLNSDTFLKITPKKSKLKYLQKENWICHNIISIKEKSENTLQFKRKNINKTFNYYCAFTKNPLDCDITLKLNVKSIYKSDRFIDFGIISKNLMEQKKKDYINRYNSGGISYCGYSQSDINGKIPTTIARSNLGLKKGSEFFLKYEHENQLSFYDKEGKLDLKKDIKGFNEPFYLYVVIYHPPTKFWISLE